MSTTVTPQKRLCNEAYRNREYLDIDEISAILAACKRFPRHGERNYWMVFFMIKHGLRCTELIELKWSQIDLMKKIINIKRLKNGKESNQILSDSQLAYLTQLKAKRKCWQDQNAVFLNPQGNPFTVDGIYKIVIKLGELSNIDIKLHTHMFRHSCGFYLTEYEERNIRFVQDYLGHRDIKNTVRYTEFSHKKFSSFFENFEKDISKGVL